MKLPNTAMQIKNSKDYIDIDGSVYTYRSNYKGVKTDTVVKKAQYENYGYRYCGIYNNETKRCEQRRVHRLVAEAFLPNPNNLPVVGHKNNIKNDNRVDNLYWTTWKENIIKAHNDGLCEQNSGAEDSQSKPVVMFNTTTNEVLGRYGSIREAVKETGLSQTTIARQAKYHRPVRKPYYFRYADDETVVQNQIVGKFDYDTDKLLAVYFNAAEAARQNRENKRTVSQQVEQGKPKHKFSEHYYATVSGKCEQTIESEKQVE